MTSVAGGERQDVTFEFIVEVIRSANAPAGVLTREALGNCGASQERVADQITADTSIKANLVPILFCERFSSLDH
jgi:hypothetical protein